MRKSDHEHYKVKSTVCMFYQYSRAPNFNLFRSTQNVFELQTNYKVKDIIHTLLASPILHFSLFRYRDSRFSVNDQFETCAPDDQTMYLKVLQMFYKYHRVINFNAFRPTENLRVTGNFPIFVLQPLIFHLQAM